MSSITTGMTICACGLAKMNPARGAAGLKVTVPAVGSTSPAISRSSVDLPEPLAPTTATDRSLS